MKRLPGLVLILALFAGANPQPAVATHNNDVIKVMTRNQYLGADLTPVIAAGMSEESISAALAQIWSNNFPRRAKALAREVAFTRPDVMALQEVFNFEVNGHNPGRPFVDHLAETLSALEREGLHYKVAAMVEHFDLTIPIDIYGDSLPESLRILDRDVILVKKGVSFKTLGGHFLAGGLCGVPVPNPAYYPGSPFPEELTSTVSEDGCNYTAVATLPSPVGPITVERGFVGVDVKVRGRDYRVVDTHLEVRFPDPTDPNSAILQFLQSVELAGTLLTIPSDKELILLGDFNSSPVDIPIGPIVPPYQIIATAGFTDVWDTNPFAMYDPDGFTCCEQSDLANRRTMQYERIDIIFVRGGPYKPWALVTGRFPIFPLFIPPNWASDHGGVFGKLFFKRW